MLYVLDLLSTICFAFMGAHAARKTNACWPVIAISAMLVATGGGTVREVLLRSDYLFWLNDISYAAMVAVGIVTASLIDVTARKRRPALETADCLATSVFVLVGIEAAIYAQCHWILVPLMGVLTGIGGGIIREAVFEGRFHTLKNNSFTKLIFILSVTATIAIFFKVHSALVLVGVSIIHLEYKLGYFTKRIKPISTQTLT